MHACTHPHTQTNTHTHTHTHTHTRQNKTLEEIHIIMETGKLISSHLLSLSKISCKSDFLFWKFCGKAEFRVIRPQHDKN